MLGWRRRAASGSGTGLAWARAVVTLPDNVSAVRRLPLHLPALRRLEARGVDLAVRHGERAEDFEARIETALMVAFRDGGAAEDFEALYEYARGNLIVWISSLAAGRRAGVEATDLLQDTFVNVFRYAAGFKDQGPRSFRVWSRTIAGNLVRRARYERNRSTHDLPEGLQEPTDRRAGPAQELTDGEDRHVVARAWMLLLARYAAAYEKLSARDQLALTLIEVEGRSYQEACRELRVGLSNLKMILFRARRRIRAAIALDLGSTGASERPVRSVRRAG
jgi:RNA polymerase sigma factor (sigma-70 family)